MLQIEDFAKRKEQRKKISMLTCYDYSFARWLNDSPIDCLLVGDSVAMVQHGFPSTLHADLAMMKTHTAAVRRGAPDKFLVADMPFLSFRKGKYAAVEAAGELLRSGANAVKLEGVEGHEEVISFLVQSGIPVMGHLGLTPQSVHQLSGYKVQGREANKAEDIIEQARKLQQLGAFAYVLECIPVALMQRLKAEVKLPSIGIGAGHEADGQVLVLQDMLGLNKDFRPRFVRQFSSLEAELNRAFQSFHQEVEAESFPNQQESFV